jgi:hypothetical protein
MSEFLRSDATLDKIAREAVDPTAMVQAMKAHLTATGVIAVERGAEYGARLLRQPEIDAPAAPPAAVAAPVEPRCVRTIYPGGNDRYELFGQTEAELDEKERNIRAMYPSAR